ncbi:hypothetical protein RAC89_30370 [Paenibacillus sp. GD4]|uniref:hypothetical protein n=1 Tax=Paenibacillus sp. GD4 TaxID=3068890 RepID=UPI0027967965|nr:hypothetical protein [Paenibacillus sp. GD4]MDQ1914691.1 hypothetical protein [Paenibacillus sp. GD4]
MLLTNIAYAVSSDYLNSLMKGANPALIGKTMSNAELIRHETILSESMEVTGGSPDSLGQSSERAATVGLRRHGYP